MEAELLRRKMMDFLARVDQCPSLMFECCRELNLYFSELYDFTNGIRTDPRFLFCKGWAHFVGWRDMHGRCFKIDYELAGRYFWESALENCMWGWYGWGLIHFYGVKSGTPDYARALELFSRVKIESLNEIEYYIGRCYLEMEWKNEEVQMVMMREAHRHLKNAYDLGVVEALQWLHGCRLKSHAPRPIDFYREDPPDIDALRYGYCSDAYNRFDIVRSCTNAFRRNDELLEKYQSGITIKELYKLWLIYPELALSFAHKVDQTQSLPWFIRAVVCLCGGVGFKVRHENLSDGLEMMRKAAMLKDDTGEIADLAGYCAKGLSLCDIGSLRFDDARDFNSFVERIGPFFEYLVATGRKNLGWAGIAKMAIQYDLIHDEQRKKCLQCAETAIKLSMYNIGWNSFVDHPAFGVLLARISHGLYRPVSGLEMLRLNNTMRWYSVAIDNGSVRALYEYAMLLESMAKNAPEDLLVKLYYSENWICELLRHAAQFGCCDAQLAYGRRLVDDQEAYRYIKMAADAGCVEAQIEAAGRRYLGKGVEAERVTSLKFIEEFAEAHNELARKFIDEHDGGRDWWYIDHVRDRFEMNE